MKRRIIWLVVSVLMVLSLVLASCAPKVTEEEEVVKEEVVKEEVAKEVVVAKEEVAKEVGVGMVVDALGRLVPKPRYGGWLTIAWASGPVEVDELNPRGQHGSWGQFHSLVQEHLADFDVLKGPNGTKLWDGSESIAGVWPVILAGTLAESTEIIEPDTFRLAIRKGVYFQDKPPANGREMTPNDVVYTLRRVWGTPRTLQSVSSAFLADMKNLENSIYIDPDDPRTVVVKIQPGFMGVMWENLHQYIGVVPQELESIGGKARTWRDITGTGPFILTDYVSGSSITLVRNPNYWDKDPFYPQLENRFPYLDGVKSLIIPDIATRLAALRTGKIDVVTSPPLRWEEAAALKKTNPELLWGKGLSAPRELAMRNDVKPFDNVKVRQAMMMAINHREILDTYFGGEGEIFGYPTRPQPMHAGFHTPLEEMPEIVQLMYGYHPDIAMKMLDEAGYPGPNRFTTSVMVNASLVEDLDLVEIVASYWAKIGVTLEIDIREHAVYTSMEKAKTYKQGAMYSASHNEFRRWITTRVDSTYNNAMVNYPLVEQTYERMQKVYFDREASAKIVKEVAPELASQAFQMVLVAPAQFIFWQPWLKNYHGEAHRGYGKEYSFAQYIWIDQELKQKMTGRR